jgi:hypothetical protein
VVVRNVTRLRGQLGVGVAAAAAVVVVGGGGVVVVPRGSCRFGVLFWLGRWHDSDADPTNAIQQGGGEVVMLLSSQRAFFGAHTGFWGSLCPCRPLKKSSGHMIYKIRLI